MRTFLLGLLVGSLIVSAIAMAQSNSERETIRVGTDLNLGMAEDAAVKKLAEAGYSPQRHEAPKGLRDRGVTSMWSVDERGVDDARLTFPHQNHQISEHKISRIRPR